jgi:flavin-dependent dehydrogenase
VNAVPRSVDDFDVVILGGGPAGCATALALARHGVSRVLLVEAGRYQAVRVGEGVPPDIRTVLQQLGVWEAFVTEEHEPCLGSCSSWGADALGYNDFLFNPLGNGWHLDRMRFDAFMAREVAKRGVALRTGTRFDDCRRVGEDGFLLRLRDEDQQQRVVAARFAVDATGVRSCFARAAGARRRFLDQLLCITGFLELPSAAGFSKLTMLEAVEYGWWYAARLPNDRLAVAVASDPETIKQKALRRRDNWLGRLAETTHISAALAGRGLVEGTQVTCAAPSFLLDRVAGAGWLAVGDAASAYDPISSQGIYKALADGARAGEAVAARLRGDGSKLGAYQSSVVSQFQQYLENRNFFYGIEQRWPKSSFWTRRRTRTAPISAEEVVS